MKLNLRKTVEKYMLALPIRAILSKTYVKVFLTFFGFAILFYSLCGVAAQEPVPTEDVVINYGAIGAIVGVFLRVYIKWKEKEHQLGHKLEFDWRYGYIGIFNMAIELIPSVIIPAISLGAVFATGDPIIDFFNGLFRGAIATSLITLAMKHIRPVNLPEG